MRKTQLFITFLLLLFVVSPSMAQAQLKGRVYWDENGNGQKESSEKGVAGAVVSDGYHVMQTGEDGYFELSGWSKQRFVTLYPGSGFACSKRYLQIDEHEAPYNFGVRSEKKKENVSFVQISDTETYEHKEWVDQLKEYVEVHQPDFIVHTGDICYRSGMLWHSTHMTSEDMGTPVYYCLGNHDLIKGDYGEHYFEQRFGPAWYAFEEGNTLFVVTPMMGGDYKPGFTREDIGGWLKNLLEAYDRDQPKFFFNHDLLTYSDTFRFRVSEKEEILLNDYNLKAWAYGHWHVNMRKKHGPSGIVSYGTSPPVMGGIDHSPSGFRVINVDKKGDPSSHFRWTYLDREIQITSPAQDTVSLRSDGTVEILVNTYHTGATVDSVKYGIWAEGFNWATSLEKDRWKHMQQKSDWSWKITFQPGEVNSFELVVNAYLADGQVLHRKKKFVTGHRLEDKRVDGHWHNLAGNKDHHPIVPENQGLPYELEWTASSGSNIFMSSPVVHKNYVMSSSFDDGKAADCHILCWNASTGEEVWRHKTRNGVKNQMVIAQGLLIATDMEGITYALEVETGELAWQKDLEYNRLPAFVTGLVTDGEVVYTGYGQSLCALEVSSGKRIWKNVAWEGGEGATPTMTIAGDVLIVSKHWGALYAHDTETGELLWSRSDEGLRFRDGVVSCKDGYLWVAERKTAETGKLHKIDPDTGETVGGFPTMMQNTGTSAPAVLEDKIIVAGSHPGIAAFSRISGKKLWEFEVDPAMFYTPSYFSDRQQSIESTPMVIGNKVLFGAMDGNLYALDADSGRLMWQKRLGSPVLTTVAVGSKRFYVCDFAGNIYCFKAAGSRSATSF